MNSIIIKNVFIRSFRNLKDVSFNFGTESNIIRGNNMQGKTNVLNAIMWCLCGVDLEGSNNDYANVPFDLRKRNLEAVVDVIVETTAGSVRRMVNIYDSKTTQRLFINQEETDIKIGDMKIDQMFGLLELSLYDTSSIKIKRLLLNPFYYTQCSQNDFRKWLLKIVCKNGVDEKSVLEQSNLNDKVKDLIASGLAVYGDINRYLRAIADNIKAKKTEIGHLEYARDVLEIDVDERLREAKRQKFISDEKQVAITEYADFLNNHYSSIVGNTNIKIVLLEQGREENIFTPVCYPKLISNYNLPTKMGSTAEKIFASCLMIQTISDFSKIGLLPMLIDEGETLDSNMLSLLNKEVSAQKIITCVAFNETEGVKLEVI